MILPCDGFKLETRILTKNHPVLFTEAHMLTLLIITLQSGGGNGWDPASDERCYWECPENCGNIIEKDQVKFCNNCPTFFLR